jgi:hypothetical protein
LEFEFEYEFEYEFEFEFAFAFAFAFGCTFCSPNAIANASDGAAPDTDMACARTPAAASACRLDSCNGSGGRAGTVMRRSRFLARSLGDRSLGLRRNRKTAGLGTFMR